MKSKNELQFSTKDLMYPLLFLLMIVFVFWLESRFNLNFNRFGIYPRKIEGLRGILFGPFIHGDSSHLFNNSIPLVVLSTALFYFYKNIRWKVLFLGILLTGILTWIIGRPSLHIGASGVIYMLTAFLMFKGIFSKQYQLTALSFIVIFLYGGFIWYLFPIDPKISWEGHLSGFLVGFVFALVFKNPPLLENKKYAWEQEDFNPEEDPFLQQFDEDGNFIEKPKEITEVDDSPPFTIRYIIKKDKSKPNKDL
ncbi:MAG: membrane associated rhomboid family serine protease [Flavobacteriaceae bacterium]|jgi:membrane associated rhomboid family serine protease|uniref:rhomboid family intramembrane serine protease n=1 Tax=Candidatus Marifrigoribacter sp. Uisw_064 TaxID=3230970 RepID=UPI003AE6C77E